MGSNANSADPSLLPEIGPDGLPREAPVIAYTEKIIEEEKLQLRKYIEENYSKIRDVERELANLNLELKLTAGSKNAAFEHLRKKIEIQNEKIKAAKAKELQAKKVWEAAAKVVTDEEAIKQKLCEDLNQLVQESSNSQYKRLEELKRRIEALNPGRATVSMVADNTPTSASPAVTKPEVQGQAANAHAHAPNEAVSASASASAQNQQAVAEGEGRGKKKVVLHGRGKGIGAVPKGRGPAAPGWTGAGFDVDGRT